MFSIRKSNSKGLPINEDIKFAPTKTVRVVGPESEQLGLMQFSNARKSAFDQGYDLVLIAPQADPPVCRIMDYGKYRFEREKKEKENRKKQQIVELKELQLTCNIGDHDFRTKVSHAHRFLTGGNKVKVLVKFKGREMAHTERGEVLLQRFLDACAEYGQAEKPPVLEGRNMILLIAPNKTTTNLKGNKKDGKDQDS